MNEPRTVTFNPTELMPIIQGGAAVVTDADGIVVDSDVMYEEAGTVLAQVKGSIKRIEEAKESMLKPVRELDRAIRGFFDPALKRRQDAEAMLKSKMLGYHAQKEREAEAARRAAEEATRKERERLEAQAAAERARAEQEAAEKRRQAEEAEAARQRAIAAGNAAAASAAAAKAAKLNEQADAKSAAGERAAADLSERAQLTSVAPVAVVAPSMKGTSIRKKWKARVTDKAALVAAIAANPKAYLHLVDINDSALNKMAGAQEKGLEAVLPGIEVYPEQNLGSRAA